MKYTKSKCTSQKQLEKEMTQPSFHKKDATSNIINNLLLIYIPQTTYISDKLAY